MYKDSKTAEEYTRYNTAFQKWYNKAYGKREITEAAAREYV